MARAHLSRDWDVELIRIGSGFTWLAEDPDEPRALAQQALQVSQELALSDRYGLLVLDEINCAIAERLVAVESVVQLLEAKAGQAVRDHDRARRSAGTGRGSRHSHRDALS